MSKAKDHGCIYMIKCLCNGKAYVGQTRRTLHERMRQHLRSADQGVPTRLYHAMRKYGKANFIVGIVEDNIHKDELNNREVYYVAQFNTYNSGYNATAGGDNVGVFTEERKQKIGAASKGRRLSDRAKALIGATHRGKVMTEEAKQKISKTMSELAKTNNYESRFANGLGTEAPSFKPWWYERDGIRTEVLDCTLKDYAIRHGYSVSTFTKNFGKHRVGKPILVGMFAGMTFGYIGVSYE